MYGIPSIPIRSRRCAFWISSTTGPTTRVRKERGEQKRKACAKSSHWPLRIYDGGCAAAGAALLAEPLAESGRLARALDKESAAVPHLRKLRLTLEPKAEPHTLRLKMPCDCGSCIVKAQMKAGAS